MPTHPSVVKDILKQNDIFTDLFLKFIVWLTDENIVKNCINLFTLFYKNIIYKNVEPQNWNTCKNILMAQNM